MSRRFADIDKVLSTSIEERQFAFQKEDLIAEHIVVYTVYKDLARALFDAEVKDVGEIVRCKECKHQKTCDHARRLGIYGYCSDGERRNDG